MLDHEDEVLIGGVVVDKTKIKYGMIRIAQSIFSFLTPTFLRLFGIVLVLAAIVLFVELIGRYS